MAIQTPIGNGNSHPGMNAFDMQWRADYDGINRANEVLKILDQVDDMTDEEKNRVAAEARFLRGHFYFNLKRMFNMVPWIDETTTNVKQPNDKDIWPFIEDDFQFAMNNLPEIQPNIAKVNKWAAASYLAKSYAYREKWQEAKNLFDNIITQGVTFNRNFI
ncbi:MAG: RagB/SusD family nutrient uptake outer membrane protein [Balneolaceae bacterium]|nr:RagB/SusD family nutrient uptake outer membrane protein [Balneolaceae bacterium]